MGYSKEQIEQVKQAVDIVDVIDSYVPLKKRGAYFWALSPFKKEKTPSFSVHPHKQFFKCYASGQSGDVFDFVVLYENLEFPEAVRRLAERAGIRLQESGPQIDQSEKKKIDLFLHIHDQVRRYWSHILLHDSHAQLARDYMSDRAIPLDWAEKYGLGYAPDSWQDMLEWGKKQGFQEKDLIESGLAILNEQGRTYDRFRGRLLFPISNDAGRTIAFSGRILDPEAKTAKYVNSPETPIFTKSKVLFAFHQAKRPILDKDCAIICEGQIDVLRCHDAGISHVTAPLGTSFTTEHAKAIRRLTSNVILCLDSDSAGQSATDRTARIFLQPQDNQNQSSQRLSDLSVRIINLPQGHDPDSIIRAKGPDAFRELLSNPVELIDFFIDLQKAKHTDDSIASRRSIIEEVTKLIQQLPTPTLREQNISRAAYRLNTSPDLIRTELQRMKPHHPRKASQNVPEVSDEPYERPAPHFSPDPLIHELILLLLSKQQFIPELQRILIPEWVSSKPGGELLIKMIELFTHDAWDGITSLLSSVSPSQAHYLNQLNLSSLDNLEVEDETCLKQIHHACHHLHREHLNNQLILISEKLKQPDLPYQEEASLREDQKALVLKRRDLKLNM